MKDPDWGKGYNYDKHMEALKLFSSSGPDFSDAVAYMVRRQYEEIMRPRWWELWRWPGYWRVLRGWRKRERMDRAIIAKAVGLYDRACSLENTENQEEAW